jgi:hypothetical protein
MLEFSEHVNVVYRINLFLKFKAVVLCNILKEDPHCTRFEKTINEIDEGYMRNE